MTRETLQQKLDELNVWKRGDGGSSGAHFVEQALIGGVSGNGRMQQCSA